MHSVSYTEAEAAGPVDIKIRLSRAIPGALHFVRQRAARDWPRPHDPKTLLPAVASAQGHDRAEGCTAAIGRLYDLGARAPRLPVTDFA